MMSGPFRQLLPPLPGAVLAAFWLLVNPGLASGPFSAAKGNPGNEFDPPIPGFTGPMGDGVVGGSNVVNPAFVAWADRIISYEPANREEIDLLWTDPTQALGPVTGDHFRIVSLGELSPEQIAEGVSPGTITLGFPVLIQNRPGPDFVVFENAFAYSDGSVFGELAYVEVSSDGTHFARFPSVSLIEGPVGIGGFDPTLVYNLAGKHANGYGFSWGTPFDLDGLKEDPWVRAGKVDLSSIRYVRLVDIPGTGDFLDSQGNPIFDAYPTFGSGGFDLEAVGVLHAPVSFQEWLEGWEATPQGHAVLEAWQSFGINPAKAYLLQLSPGQLPNGPVFTLSHSSGLRELVLQRHAGAIGATIHIEISGDLRHWEILAKSEGGLPFVSLDDNWQIHEEGESARRTVRVKERESGSGDLRSLRLRVEWNP